jgi:hypothetical protein
MDIGPVRRRFTAEPISSPVPAAQDRVPESPQTLEQPHEQTPTLPTHEIDAVTRA